MRKSSFVEGSFVAYLAIVITKIMGALYSIPFYEMIGDQGGVIYSCAYSVYALFLDISTSGIPIAVSIVISDYNAQKMYQSRERAYRMSFLVVAAVSLVSFVMMQVFARAIGRYFLGDMTGGVRIEDIAAGVRVVSICLLIAPLLSIKRGYLQGNKYLSVSSFSQVIEQLVRIVVVLAGTYFVMYVLNMGTTTGVCVALAGTAVGALAAYIYLLAKGRGTVDEVRLPEDGPEHIAADREIARKILAYCTTIVIMSVSVNLYNIIDMKMLLVGLHNVGYSDEDTQVISSIASTWVPKICAIITALSSGLVSSIAPHMAENRSTGNWEDINRKLVQALGIILLVSLPLGIGMIVYAQPIFCLFFGENPYGPAVLQFAILANIVGSMATVNSMSMQSIGRGKTVCVVLVTGIVLNTVLDLPMIYLFNALGLPAFLGASVASVIGYGFTSMMLMTAMKKDYKFRYGRLLEILRRELLPMAAMVAVALGIRALWTPVESRGLLMVVQLCVYALTGGVVYLLLAYRTGALQMAMGEKFLDRLLRRRSAG